MQPTEDQLEQIVREVLARLDGNAPIGPALPASANSSINGNASSVLRIASPVVSLAQLQGKLEGIQQLELRRGAVLTPALRDLLRQHQVSVTYQVTNPSAGSHSAAQVVAGVAETSFEPAGLLAKVRSSGIQAELLPKATLIEVLDALCEAAVKEGKRGLLITENDAAALCLANRRRGVRAAAAHDKCGVDEALTAVGMNLLVINPRGKSRFQLQGAILRFAQAEEPSCPDAYRKLLDG